MSQTHADMMSAPCRTLVDILRWRARYQPERKAYTFLADGEVEEATVTYGELDRQARSTAARLQKHTSIGDRAVLLYPPGLDYVAAFLGCLYAGVVAVPAYPPSSNRSLARIQSITVDAETRVFLSTGSIFAKVQNWSKQLPELLEAHWLITDDGQESRAEQWQEYTPTPEGITFLQYTSGSTGNPRGVIVSHGNLIDNEEMIRTVIGHTEESVGVSWLPMFHDMGLIFGVLQALYTGFWGILMAPAAFIQRPLRWLQAISRYRATSTAAPNFAYELCLNRISEEERAQLDLSSLKLAANAAEPVRAETVSRFIEVFGTCGFPARAMNPSYGLAETTLMVSTSFYSDAAAILQVDKAELEQHRVVVSHATDEKATLSIVGCGRMHQQIAIVHPETRIRCAADQVGEIWVKGESVAQGYWKRPEETENTFHAVIAGTNEGPFLRTGDLGFIYDGQLYITGRIKDLIIIRGRNYYPQDIELVVERSHPSLRKGCGAAFSVEVENEERLVVIQEVMRDYQDPEAIIKAIRQAVAEVYEIRAYAVVLIRYGSLLKTSSGKIQRRASREQFLANELRVIASDTLADVARAGAQDDPQQREEWLRRLAEVPLEEKKTLLQALITEQAQQVLVLPQGTVLTPQDNLLAAGMDSLMATQLMNRLQVQLGRSLPDALAFVMNEPTIEKLADYLLAEVFNAGDATRMTEASLNEWLGEVANLSDAEAEARLLDTLVGLDGDELRI